MRQHGHGHGLQTHTRTWSYRRTNELHPPPAHIHTHIHTHTHPQESARFPNAQVVWVQEEPKNMGCWTFVQDRILTVIKVRTKHNNTCTHKLSLSLTHANTHN